MFDGSHRIFMPRLRISGNGFADVLSDSKSGVGAVGSGSDRAHQSSDPNQRDHAFDIVGEDVERHFGAHIFQTSRQEMTVPQPCFDGAERVLDG